MMNRHPAISFSDQTFPNFRVVLLDNPVERGANDGRVIALFESGHLIKFRPLQRREADGAAL